MRNYLGEFHDLAMVVDRVTMRDRQFQSLSDNSINLIRPLLIDLLKESTSYHKKRNIREKLFMLLELTP